MGQLSVTRLPPEDMRLFTRRLVADVHALESMIAQGKLESGRRRIGCEQEMFLVDRAWTASPSGEQILQELGDGSFTTELGKFNLELNLEPLSFDNDCLFQMEAELRDQLNKVRRVAGGLGVEIVLTGILPTLRKSDLGLENMTAKPRYSALNEAIGRLRGGYCEFHLDGADELIVRHDSIMLEACCTSFQAHYQGDAETFVKLYNTAQAVTGPLLACAVNSPLLFGRRLWAETRIPLFQQAVDTRQASASLRALQPRVSFGNRWLKRSATELFQEDIARFPALIAATAIEDSRAKLRNGEIPRLDALQVYNSTVYRWNRACYGITGGKPHLRIENRALPAGPTVLDEVANAAFFFGMLRGMPSVHDDIAAVMNFEDARANFLAAAREGMLAGFRWIGGAAVGARDLLLKELLPIATAGLRAAKIRDADIRRYLGVIEARVSSMQTGSKWILQSLENLNQLRGDSAVVAITAGIAQRQWDGDESVHQWLPVIAAEGKTMKREALRIEEAMTTDLFTIHPDETIDMVANIMAWKNVRHVPVEDETGNLLGLVSCFEVLRYFNRGDHEMEDKTTVKAVMNPSPLTAPPELPAREAIALMVSRKADCLLVVKDNRLTGIVTEHDILNLASDLMG